MLAPPVGSAASSAPASGTAPSRWARSGRRCSGSAWRRSGRCSPAWPSTTPSRGRRGGGRARAGALRRGFRAALPRGPARPRRATRPAAAGVRRDAAPRRRAPGHAAHRAGRVAVDHGSPAGPDAAVDGPARARRGGARRRVGGGHVVALPAADGRGAGRGAHRVLDRAAHQGEAVPGHLVGAATCRRHRPARGGDRHRRAGGQGLRSGGP